MAHDLETRKILLSAIELPEPSLRAATAEAVAALAANIAEHGLLHPVIVFALAGGRFHLVAGRHRVAAFVSLGRTEIPARILPGAPSESEQLQITYSENESRRDFTPGERLAIIAKLQGLNPDWTLERLAEKLTSSASQLSVLLTTAVRLPPDLKLRWEQGELPNTIAYQIGRAASEDEQRQLLAQYEQGLHSRTSLAKAVTGKRSGGVKGRKLTLKQSGWTVSITGPSPLTPESIAELLKRLDKAVQSAQRQNLPASILPALFAKAN